MDRQEILLKEYETCQSDNNTLASRFWVVSGIYVSLNTAILAGLLAASTSSGGAFPVATIKPLSLMLGLGTICINVLLFLYQTRINYTIQINYYRIQQIESEVGMRKGYLIDALDRWKKLPDEKKKQLSDLRDRFPSRSCFWLLAFWRYDKYVPPLGRWLSLIFVILVVFWVVFIVFLVN
ncbi:MAG: hypothetical protein HYX80_08645 [Chloroflexi bacterium]|nr:hypothetical protein [Chloroflexota bacterium]